jgi:hypothetical protein
MSKIDDKNRREEQFISSRAFHQTLGERVRKTTVGEQFGSQNLELFELVAHDEDRAHGRDNDLLKHQRPTEAEPDTKKSHERQRSSHRDSELAVLAR